MLPLLPTGLSSTIVLDPTSFPLSATMSLMRISIAGSWSLFSRMSPEPNPHSAMYSRILSNTNFPKDPFIGTTVDIAIPVVLSLPTSKVNLYPNSSPGKQ